jgi:Flp pilus assembly protein TadD
MDRAVQADEIADRVHVRWTSSAEAVRVRAQARVRAAEEDTPRWSAVRVRAAVEALERWKFREPTDVWPPAMMAWVRYKGGQSVEHAWSELTAILPRESDPTMPADVLEVLGTLYYARGQYDDAVRVLTRAAAAARQPAGPLVTLALAYHKKGDARAAREVLQKARLLTKSDRVNEEYVTAAAIITKE